MNVRKILREYSLLVLLLLLFILCIPSSFAGGVGRAMDPLLQEEYCKNFTYGNKDKEFFSPGFPRDYPPGIKCFRTISADYGYFVRVDFRDYFNIEPPTNEGNCDYDYLEVGQSNFTLKSNPLQILLSYPTVINNIDSIMDKVKSFFSPNGKILNNIYSIFLFDK